MNTTADHSVEERAAASAVASLSTSGWKRERDAADAAGGLKLNKVARVEVATCAEVGTSSPTPSTEAPSKQATISPYPSDDESLAAPFFHYKDFSRLVDSDPLTPLTVPGRVPNFPAKMHAILSRPDLVDIVSWMPHGRSWRVLKPREFETQVIPRFFEHSKFSSFVRQANGWGFRRVTQGRDRNSYYHPQFLRGLPHLCKQMKRPGVSEKVSVDPDHEPDFYKISEMHPVPDKASDDSILLQCTVQGGPKARMPVYMGALAAEHVQTAPVTASIPSQIPAFDSRAPLALSPDDQIALASLHHSLATANSQIQLGIKPQEKTVAQGSLAHLILPHMSYLNTPMTCLMPSATDHLPMRLHRKSPSTHSSVVAQEAASQFAAGFAAATALNSNQAVKSILGQAIQSGGAFGRGSL